MSQHPLKTIQDIIDVVTSDNIDNFMNDFRATLESAIIIKSLYNERVISDVILWTDDGIKKCEVVVAPETHTDRE